MKRVLLAVFVGMLCAWPVSSYAEGIKAADQMVSVFLGGSAPLQQSGIYSEDVLGDPIGNEELEWGDGAASYGVQYLYAVSDQFAFGLEYMGNSFGEAEYERSYFFDASNWGKEELESKMNVNNFMVAGRFTANPASRVRFYIPVGLGLASAKATLDYEGSLMNSGTLEHASDSSSASSTSFAYYLGLGLEGDFNENWIWGVEGRYSAFTMDYGKFDGSDYGKEDLSYFSLLFKLSYKF